MKSVYLVLFLIVVKAPIENISKENLDKLKTYSQNVEDAKAKYDQEKNEINLKIEKQANINRDIQRMQMSNAVFGYSLGKEVGAFTMDIIDVSYFVQLRRDFFCSFYEYVKVVLVNHEQQRSLYALTEDEKKKQKYEDLLLTDEALFFLIDQEKKVEEWVSFKLQLKCHLKKCTCLGDVKSNVFFRFFNEKRELLKATCKLEGESIKITKNMDQSYRDENFKIKCFLYCIVKYKKELLSKEEPLLKKVDVKPFEINIEDIEEIKKANAIISLILDQQRLRQYDFVSYMFIYYNNYYNNNHLNVSSSNVELNLTFSNNSYFFNELPKINRNYNVINDLFVEEVQESLNLIESVKLNFITQDCRTRLDELKSSLLEEKGQIEKLLKD